MPITYFRHREAVHNIPVRHREAAHTTPVRHREAASQPWRSKKGTHCKEIPTPSAMARDDANGGMDLCDDASGERLTTPEKRSLLLVLLGTFLEYFDFVLYVHLAIVLNPLFFPSTDPKVAALLGVFAFASAYVLRPLGGFVFGYVGDKKGRKASIVWTSCLMGLAALTIACLPPYATLGFTASMIFILARAIQGFSSIGETVGAKVFTAELTERSPYVHLLSILPAVTMISGSMTALGAGLLSLHLDPLSGWRWPFLFGAVVALVGGLIRLKAIESPAFVAAQERKKQPTTSQVLTFARMLNVRQRNYWAFFGIEAVTPLTLYFTLRVCSDLLKRLGLSAPQVIAHNFWVTLLNLLVVIGYGFLTLKTHPMTILKRRVLIGVSLIPLLMSTLAFFPSETTLFIVQLILLCTLAGSATPAQFIIIQAFPVIGRCSNLGSIYAICHAGMYVITSFVVVLLDQSFGLWGVGALFMITSFVALFSAHRFIPTDKAPPSIYEIEKTCTH